MFSSATMLLSSVMPIAKAMPARDITLIVRPATDSPRNAASVQTGIPMAPIRVAGSDFRNSIRTRVASSAPMTRLVTTVRTDALT